MRFARFVVLALIAALLPAAAVGAEATGGAPPADAPAEIGPGVREAVAARAAAGPPIVAYLDPGVDPVADALGGGSASSRAIDRALATLPDDGVALRYRAEHVPVATFEVTSLDALDALAAAPGVVRLDLDSGGTGDLAEVVPLIGADTSHTDGATGAGVRVAVFDTGIDRDHPDLADDLVHEECFGYDGNVDAAGFCPNGLERQSGAGSAEDDAGHGTHVNGIITSKGVVAPVGVAPDAEMVAFKIMDDCSFSGCFYSFTESVVAPMDWIIANNGTWGIDVINASIGTGFTHSGDCDAATSWTMAGAAAVSTLRAMGVTFFASAGNSDLDAMSAPACLSGVVSVGASTDTNFAASFSNASATTDVFAPGVGVVSDAIGGGTTPASGTSMASPATAACAALLLGAGNVTTPDALEARLETSGVFVSKNLRSYPRVICDTTVATPPPPPAPVLVVSGDGTVTVSWTDAGHGGSPITGYKVIEMPAGTVTPIAAGTTFTTVTGLTNGLAYSFSVIAVNGEGESLPAFSRSVRPTVCDVEKALPPPGPFTDVATSHPFCGEIEWLAATGVTTGFADGSFGASAPVTRQAMSAFMARWVGMGGFTPPAEPTFSDVPTSHPFYTEIEWMSSEGVSTGYPDGTFRPSQTISRLAMAAFLYRVAGEPPFLTPSTATFSDVPTGHPFFHVIEWLASTGITGGFPDGTFRPVDAVSRQAMAAFLFRFDALFG